MMRQLRKDTGAHRQQRKMDMLAVAALSLSAMGLGGFMYVDLMADPDALIIAVLLTLVVGALVGLVSCLHAWIWKRNLRRSASGLLAILIGVFCLASAGHWAQSGIGGRAWAISNWVLCYIDTHNGSFPASQVHLVDAGYLRKIDSPSGTQYFIRSGPDSRRSSWIEMDYFDRFHIAYGVTADDFEVRDAKLWDKSTDKEILLIKGPYMWYLRKSHYRPISLRWYEMMAKATQAAKESPEIPMQDNTE